MLPLRQIWPHLGTACVGKPQYISGQSGRPLSEGHSYPGEKKKQTKLLKFNLSDSCNVNTVNLQVFYVLDKYRRDSLATSVEGNFS